MFHFRRKKSIALLLTVCFLFVMVMPGYAADTKTTADSCTVGVAVVDNQGNLIFGSKNVTVQDSSEFGMTALGALDAAGVPYETKDYGSMGHMITSINGIANEGLDGWMYTVNDKHATQGADAYEIKEGDHIVWYYGTMGSDSSQWDSLQIPDSITLEPSSITLEKDDTKQVKAVLSYVNGETKDVTEEVEWTVEDSSIASVDNGIITALKAGTTTVSVAKDGITAQLQVQVGQTESVVSIAIVGKDGELLYAPEEITVEKSGEWGVTAFGALDATGIEYEVDEADYGQYLKSVDGQAAEGMAGWMYTVNDEFAPVSMDQYNLQDGDRIIIYYSSDWENPAPTWEDLTNQTPPDSDSKPDPKPDPNPGKNIEFEKALAELVSYYQNNKTTLNSWDEVVALRSAGVDLADGSWKLPDWDIAGLNEDSATTQYTGTILGMLAVGQEPTAADGRNLVQELADRQNSDGSFGDWFNETIWAIIALDTAKAEYDTSVAVNYLCEKQLDDGGFALFGTDSDPDTTGMALIALASHKDIEGVPAVIDKAIKCIEGLQEESGGFASWGEESAESAAAVVRGLVACGIDPNTMVRNSNTVIAALMAYQLDDKTFSHVIGGASDSMATIQALTAMGDMAHGSVFARIRDSYIPGQYDSYPESDPETINPEDQQGTGGTDQQDKNMDNKPLPKTGGNSLPFLLAGAALLSAGTLMVRRKKADSSW